MPRGARACRRRAAGLHRPGQRLERSPHARRPVAPDAVDFVDLCRPIRRPCDCVRRGRPRQPQAGARVRLRRADQTVRRGRVRHARCCSRAGRVQSRWFAKPPSAPPSTTTTNRWPHRSSPRSRSADRRRSSEDLELGARNASIAATGGSSGRGRRGGGEMSNAVTRFAHGGRSRTSRPDRRSVLPGRRRAIARGRNDAGPTGQGAAVHRPGQLGGPGVRVGAGRRASSGVAAADFMYRNPGDVFAVPRRPCGAHAVLHRERAVAARAAACGREAASAT